MHFQGFFCDLYFLAAYSANLPVIPCLYKSIYRHIFRANLRIVSKSTESRARGTIISCSSPITFNNVQFTVKFWQKHTNVTRIFDRFNQSRSLSQEIRYNFSSTTIEMLVKTICIYWITDRYTWKLHKTVCPKFSRKLKKT